MTKLLRRLAAGLVLAAVAVALLFLLAPFVLNTWLLPVLLSELPKNDQVLSIDRLTPFSASGSLHLGESDQPGLAVPRLALRFSPLELLRKQVRALTIDHAALHLQRRGDRIIISGLSPKAPPENRSAAAPLALPFIVDRLILKQCSLILHEAGHPPLRLSISADLSVSSTRGSSGAYRLESVAGSFFLADLLAARGTLDLSAIDDGYRLSLNLAGSETNVPSHFIPPLLQGLRLGSFTAALSLSLADNLVAPTALDLQATFDEPALTLGPLSLTGAEESGTIRLSVNGPPSAVRYELSPLLLSTPELRLQAEPRGSLTAGRDGLLFTGEADILATRAAEKLPLALSWQGEKQQNGTWHLNIDGRAGSQAPLTIFGSAAAVAVPAVTLHAELTGRPRQLAARIDVELPRVDLLHGTGETRLTGTTARLQLEHRDGMTGGDLHGAVNQALLSDQDMHFDGVELSLPFMLPSPGAAGDEAGGAGSFVITSVGRSGTPLGTFAATIRQRREHIDLDGTLQAAFEPHPELHVSGSVRPAAGQFEISWQLPATSIDSSLLPVISGIPEQLGFTGTLSADGSLHRRAGRLDGSLAVALHDGTITHDEPHLNVTALDCSLTLPRLPELRSSPSQHCTAARIDIGTLQFAATDITYRLEDPRTVFIEKSRLSWCRGTLESGSIRLSTIDPEIDTVLYSSRINFADLLNQFGFDQTEGDGALNGKLPLKWSGGQLVIDDGFLFSTPGAGGIVRFTNTDLLRQGIGDVQQAGSLGYSLKALEDFAYNWSRLSFNSSGDELLMTMELDGRPRTPLPYAFKDGMLVEAEQGNLDYPIRLDVNLRLPLAELLRIGYDVKSIMGNN